MKIYFAPLEGVTGYVFRNAYEKYYGGVDKYFTPFISPHTKKLMDTREKRDVLPENNKGLYVVPQVLTNKAEELIDVCKKLKNDFGYEEVNLNLGCPSKTVTTKGKGSGFLEKPDQMERFFDEFFNKADVKLSIKTRIGYWEVEEAERIFKVYEKFPFEEVIIHPRLGCEMYKGTPHYEVFEKYLGETRHSLCYNGDINSLEDLNCLNNKWETCDKYMLGRGLIGRPGMLSEMKNGEISAAQLQNEREIFHAFHNEILDGYMEYMCGDRNTLFKMKELWTFWAAQFPGEEKLIKKIKKSTDINEYKALVGKIINF